ncbi:hypothetical protein ACQP2E_12285 [Actinoplanes sp. CA-015351]|uniref:hypothetical protein n=1 Tax=Actinoplanes sp. CA-015351 TaxID=3239897 RepID=UPI003D96D812
MTGRADFRDGRRLSAADLNRESTSQADDRDTHLVNAHPGVDDDQGLVAGGIVSPAEATTISLVPVGPSTSVRAGLPGVAEAVRLAPGGHRVTGPVRGTGTPVAATGLIRLSPVAGPEPVAAPWTLRAVEVRDDENRLIARELRVELEAPAGSAPDNSRMAVTAGAETRFVADAAGNVRIRGDVLVAGTVSQGLIGPDPADPRFVAALTDMVARRLLSIPAGPGNPTLNTVVKAGAASTNTLTALEITLTPAQRLNHLAVAMEVRREGVTLGIELVKIANSVPAGVEFPLTRSLPWDPPLSTSNLGLVVVEVVAFDAFGQLLLERRQQPILFVT